ncbi:MAG TPA: PEP-CTERM sorting domain-containing protein [Armatimonadota bacterium]|jgi:hypothetical protein
MLKKLAIVLACAVTVAVAARAVDPAVYQNTRGSYYVFNYTAPTALAALDDGHLNSPGADITSFTFGTSLSPLGLAPDGSAVKVDFDALISFYIGKPLGTPFTSAKSAANLIATYRIPFRAVSAPATNAQLNAWSVAASFTIPTQDFAIEELFVTPDGTSVNDITDVVNPFIAAGNAAPSGVNDATVGSSADLMYTDDSYDGLYDAPTAPTSFGDGVHNASLYLRLRGTPHSAAVPEPGTLALLGTIAPLAGLVIRRKRA